MAFQVVRPTDTPGIRWPVPGDAREMPPAQEDTRQPTRRFARERRSTRLRWGLLWLSAVFGGMTAWIWLARQDELKARVFTAERELSEIAALRSEMEQAKDLRPASLRLYVERTEARQAGLRSAVADLSGAAALQQAWKTEQEALREAKADLEWMEPRLRQIDVIQGAKLSNEILANEAALRPVLERITGQECCPGARFRPGLARSLRVELDRRMAEVRQQAALAVPPTPMLLPPMERRPLVLKPARVAVKPVKPVKKPARLLAAKAKVRARAPAKTKPAVKARARVRG